MIPIPFKGMKGSECRRKLCDCKECGKLFVSHKSHRRQMIVHTRTDSGSIQAHENVHTRDGLFECKVCEKVFNSTGQNSFQE